MAGGGRNGDLFQPHLIGFTDPEQLGMGLVFGAGAGDHVLPGGGDVSLGEPRFFLIVSGEDGAVDVPFFQCEDHERGRHPAGNADLADLGIRRTSRAHETENAPHLFDGVHIPVAPEKGFFHLGQRHDFRGADIVALRAGTAGAFAGQFRIPPPVVQFHLDRLFGTYRGAKSAFITKPRVDALPLEQPESFVRHFSVLSVVPPVIYCTFPLLSMGKKEQYLAKRNIFGRKEQAAACKGRPSGV